MPRVSVVMPAYNAARHVGEAVRSVLAQRDADFELLVVDDGSTDGTAEALGGIRDPRLRLLRQENRGEGGARNAGLAATGGPLVAMTDADDLWHPDKLARQTALLEARQDLAAVFTHVATIDAAGRPLQAPLGDAALLRAGFNRAFRGRDEILREFFGGRNVLAGPTVLLRRDALAEVGGYDTGLAFGTDFDLWLRLLRRHEVAVIAEPLYRYRVYPASASFGSSRAGRTVAVAAILQRALAGYRAEDLDRELAAMPAGPERDEWAARAHLEVAARLEGSGWRELLPAAYLQRLEAYRLAPRLVPRGGLLDFALLRGPLSPAGLRLLARPLLARLNTLGRR